MTEYLGGYDAAWVMLGDVEGDELSDTTDELVELSEDGDVDLAMALPGNSPGEWVPNKHPRWPKGSPGGVGGKFMEGKDVLNQIGSRPIVDLSGLAQGAPHIAGLSIQRTKNPDQLLLNVKMRAPGSGAQADVGFFISKNALGIQMLQNVLQRLNAGVQIKALSTPGLKKFAKSSYYNPYRVISRLIRSQGKGAVGLSEANEEVHMQLGELFCAEGAVEEADGLLWKVALPVGELKLSPGQNGTPVERPLRVIEGRSTSKEIIGLQDIVDAFDEGAVQHVTIPKTHADAVDENTGFVKKVRIGLDPETGRKALITGIKFTEPEIEGKAKRGSIANVSVGIAFDYLKKDSGKRFKSVLSHLALTNKPWVPGMAPFGGLAASEEGTEIIGLSVEAPEAPSADDVADALLWNPRRGLFAVRDRLNDAVEALEGGEHELVDFDGATALVKNNDTGAHLVFPYAINDEGSVALNKDDSVELPAEIGAEYGEVIEPAEDASEQTEQEDRLPEAGPDNNTNLEEEVDMDEIKALKEQLEAANAALAEAREARRIEQINTRVDELKGLGFSEAPGLLAKVRQLMLSDNGSPATVMLSEDGTSKTSLTVSQIVDQLIEAFPVKEADLGLSEQHEDTKAKEPVREDEVEELSHDDKVKAASEFYGWKS